VSILGDIFKGGKKLLQGTASTFKTVAGSMAGSTIGGMIGGPPGAMIGGAIGGGGLPPLPGGGGGLGRIGGGGLGGIIGGASRAIGGAARGAATMCAKYPQWCLAVGGVSAVASMIQSGQLPAPRRRRRRGISSRDLTSFRRVANLVDRYSKPVHRMRGYKRAACKTR